MPSRVERWVLGEYSPRPIKKGGVSVAAGTLHCRTPQEILRLSELYETAVSTWNSIRENTRFPVFSTKTYPLHDAFSGDSLHILGSDCAAGRDQTTTSDEVLAGSPCVGPVFVGLDVG